MSITQKPFGVTAQGVSVTEYTLANASGASVSILDLGGIITKIMVPDREGRLADVNLGYDDVNIYATPGASGSMGMLIGRVGNRIGGAAFDLDGKHYPLAKNDGDNNLHGGVMGFGLRMWDAQPLEDKNALVLSLVSEDGDEGFPGRLEVQVTYLFTDNNEIVMHYQANTDRTTLVNMTNHAYFNLDGHDAGSIADHVLHIAAHGVTEVDGGLIPTGRTIPSADVVYGFAAPTRIGDVLAHIDSDPMLAVGGGVDFNYCAGRDREDKVIATLYAPASGRVLEVVTDQPGVQCYTGNFLDCTGKGGAHYPRHSAICLETQHYPDAIHQPEFPTIVLRPQDTYDTVTIYRFSTR